METEKEIISKILAKITEIQSKHPELSEFFNEMPNTIPNGNNPDINIENLNHYYDSLNQILKNQNTKLS